MNAREWIDAYAARLEESPSAEEFSTLLDLAGEAAHSSERVAAPVACWPSARAGPLAGGVAGAGARGRGEVTEEPSRAQKARTAGIQLVLGMVALMWVMEVVDTIDNHRLDQYGIEPRDVEGLRGVVASFLHAGFDHLVSNTVPFVVLAC